jgi:hypothetical protein
MPNAPASLRPSLRSLAASPEKVPDQRTQRRSFFRPARHRVEITAMDVAPPPCLAAIDGGNHGMPRRIEMRERVRMFGILAAPDMTAGKADAQLVPYRLDRLALFAAGRSRFGVPNCAEVLAPIGHGRISAIDVAPPPRFTALDRGGRANPAEPHARAFLPARHQPPSSAVLAPNMMQRPAQVDKSHGFDLGAL